MNLYLDWLWLWLYLTALDSAAAGSPILYSSRIDGALMPWGAE
ncbi:MAG TPA: hypothetical protein PLC99_22335 [Verrucomicrobiota bacterium]|nr:hypothetical protein [Verrucomicrobiota bacterium]